MLVQCAFGRRARHYSSFVRKKVLKMPTCSVLWCKNRATLQSKSHSDITYHRFPKDPSIKQIWAKATGRSPEWIPTTYSTICSKHFANSLFMESKNGIRTYLDKSAVPTLHLPFYVNANENLPTTSLRNNVTEEGDEPIEDYSIMISDVTEETTPNVIQEHDTPRKIRLKRQIRRLKLKDIENMRKIKRLQYHKRKQMKKITYLEKILKSLLEKSLTKEEENDVLRNISVTSAKIAKRERSVSQKLIKKLRQHITAV